MDAERLDECAKKIADFHAASRRMPTYSEMLSLFGLKSKNAVFKRVGALVEKGLLDKDGTGRILPRAIRRPVRLLGLVQAGFPSPAEEETADLLSLDEYLISNPQSTFLLKVHGDSMKDAGIHPGDLVLIQKGLAPKTGDIVLARIDNEWTLKYFERRRGKAVLKAANDRYPLIEPRQELIIAGVVIANVRKYR
jgi:repressor LexA